MQYIQRSYFSLTLATCMALVGVCAPDRVLSAPLDVSELQRRLTICLSSEDWLRDVCLETLQKKPQETRVDEVPGVKVKTPPIFSSHDQVDEGIDEENRELHLVGIYEPTKTTDESGRIVRSGNVPVYVDRPGKSVTLVLANYESVVWDVTSAPGTTIDSISISGYRPERSKVKLNGDEFSANKISAPMAYKKEGNSFHPFYLAARKATKFSHASSFNGAYRAPKNGFLVDAAPGIPTALEEAESLKAGAISHELLPEPLARAYDSERHSAVSFGEKGFAGFLKSKKPITIPLPDDMPRVSWPVGATFDEEKGRFWGATSAGQGVLYRYEIDSDEWTAWSMHNHDAGGLIYDQETDTLVATPGMMTRNFLILNPDSGKVIEKISMNVRDFPGITRLYDPGNDSQPNLTPLGIHEGKILVRTSSVFSSRGSRAGSLTYLVDLGTKEVKIVE